MEFFINKNNNNYGIVKLIEATRKSFGIRFLTKSFSENDDSFCEILESSLIKHANTIQFFKSTKQPIKKIFFILCKFKKFNNDDYHDATWNCLKNLSLPFLQTLKVERISIKTLTNQKYKRNLTEISLEWIYCDGNENNRKIIQTVYRNCSKLKYIYAST